MADTISAATGVASQNEALRQATQQDRSAVDIPGDSQNTQQAQTEVLQNQASEDRSRNETPDRGQQTPPHVNAGLTGERPDDTDAPRGTFLDVTV